MATNFNAHTCEVVPVLTFINEHFCVFSAVKLQWSESVVRGHNHISISCSRSSSHARHEAGRLKQRKESRYHCTLAFLLLPALESTVVAVLTTHCCSDCKCSTIDCIRGRNRGISISHHPPSRHSAKKLAFSAKVSTWTNVENEEF